MLAADAQPSRRGALPVRKKSSTGLRAKLRMLTASTIPHRGIPCKGSVRSAEPPRPPSGDQAERNRYKFSHLRDVHPRGCPVGDARFARPSVVAFVVPDWGGVEDLHAARGELVDVDAAAVGERPLEVHRLVEWGLRRRGPAALVERDP